MAGLFQSGGNPVGEIRCRFITGEIRCREIRRQFIILARKDEPTSDYGAGLRGGKSGVSSSFLPGKSGEIRCQFIILARKDEPTSAKKLGRGG